jgi:hypothetical protein
MVAKLAASDVGTGRVVIEVNVASAEVRLDGAIVGQTQDRRLVLPSVAEGEHSLELSALGHLAYSQQIRVASQQQTDVRVSLEPVPEPVPEPTVIAGSIDEIEESGGGSVAWLGYTLIGVGVASLGGWGASMYVVNNTNNNDTFQAYKRAFPQPEDDVCALAESNNLAMNRATVQQVSEVKDLCSTGRAFNLLQWVFLGAGVVSASVGAIILATDDDGEPELAARQNPRRALAQSQPTLSIRPQIGRRSLALQTTLRF